MSLFRKTGREERISSCRNKIQKLSRLFGSRWNFDSVTVLDIAVLLQEEKAGGEDHQQQRKSVGAAQVFFREIKCAMCMQ